MQVLEGLFFFIFTLMKFFCIVFVARVFICSDLRYKETGYCQNEGRCTHFDCKVNGTTSRHLLYVAKLTHTQTHVQSDNISCYKTIGLNGREGCSLLEEFCRHASNWGKVWKLLSCHLDSDVFFKMVGYQNSYQNPALSSVARSILIICLSDTCDERHNSCCGWSIER